MDPRHPCALKLTIRGCQTDLGPWAGSGLQGSLQAESSPGMVGSHDNHHGKGEGSKDGSGKPRGGEVSGVGSDGSSKRGLAAVGPGERSREGSSEPTHHEWPQPAGLQGLKFCGRPCATTSSGLLEPSELDKAILRAK